MSTRSSRRGRSKSPAARTGGRKAAAPKQAEVDDVVNPTGVAVDAGGVFPQHPGAEAFQGQIDHGMGPVPAGKKHVGIIGAGAAGLHAMKELTALGHHVTCFELQPVIGGVYAKSYDNTFLTTSSLLTAFSDYSDGLEDKPKFWTDEEYITYLHGFSNKFDLFRHIHFRSWVEFARQCPETGRWTLGVKHNRYTEDHRVYGSVPAEDGDEPIVEYSFDFLAVCSGTHTWPALPRFTGQDAYQGEIYHSSDYRVWQEQVVGKRVLVIGAGESGSDICNEISKVADQTCIVIRGKHGHIIPRIQSGGRVTDLNTNRCRYSNPYILGDWVGWANQQAKKFVAKMGPSNDNNKILQKIGELNLEQKTSAFSKFGCKNEGFVTAMVKRGAEFHRGAFEFTETGVLFEDGGRFDADVVVACTGYKISYPFFEKYESALLAKVQSARNQYKQIFVPGNPNIAFHGFARPAFGAVPPTVEIQTRLLAMVVNGDVELPEEDEMREVIAHDRCNWETRFGYDAKRISALVDFQIYLDDLAAIMGCMPPLKRLFFTKPQIWWKIMFGPFTTHQYRLVGPYANPERTADVYSRTPVGDFLECSITATFLCTAKVLSMLGFKRFKPNNF